MAGIIPARFKGTKNVIQVGGLDTSKSETVVADVQTTVKFADEIVSIHAHVDLWFLIGANGATLAPAADTGIPMIAGEKTLPFILVAGNVVEGNGKLTLIYHNIQD